MAFNPALLGGIFSGIGSALVGTNPPPPPGVGVAALAPAAPATDLKKYAVPAIIAAVVIGVMLWAFKK